MTSMFLTQLHADGLHFDFGVCSGVFIRRAGSLLEDRKKKAKDRAEGTYFKKHGDSTMDEEAVRKVKDDAAAAVEKVEKKKAYFDFAPLLRVGYRWVFPSINMFLDWDFIGLPTSLTTFKIGKYFRHRKCAVYGIVDPIVGMLPGIFHTNFANIGSSSFGFGALIGLGVTYHLSRDISVLGEVHLGLPYKIFEIKDPLSLRSGMQKIDFSPYVRAVLGVSFHSREMNKD